MNHKSRVLFAVASVLTTSLVFGSVLLLANHYGSQAQTAALERSMMAHR